jgi:hypothetical protein
MINNQEFYSAKNIVDFYLEKLSRDLENPNAIYAMQWAQLKLLRLRTNATLDSLESYPIEVV